MLLTHIVTTGFLGTCSFLDIKKKAVPIRLLCLCSVIIFVSILFVEKVTVLDRICGAGFGAFFLLITWWSRQAIGVADSIWITILGIAYGFSKSMTIVLVSLVLSAVVSAILLGLRKANRKDKIPFLPFLLMGFVVVAVVGVR